MIQKDELKNTEDAFREYQKTKSPELRNKIVEANLYLAELLAHKYMGRGVEYDDLLQVASYALVLAVERFDPDKGVQFSSYATPTIIGEIKKYFRDTTWSLKVTRRLKEISTKMIDAKETLQEHLQRVPTVKELAEYMEVTEEEIIEALEGSHGYTTYSLDQETDTFAENERTQFEKYLGETEDGFDRFETSGVLEKVMAELSPTEKEVISKRFLQEITQREVAKELGVSQMTISRIEKAMREKFRSEYNK